MAEISGFMTTLERYIDLKGNNPEIDYIIIKYEHESGYRIERLQYIMDHWREMVEKKLRIVMDCRHFELKKIWGAVKPDLFK